MNEEIEYAEMLEIPVSTVNVARKRRRRKKHEEMQPTLKESVIATVNDRVGEDPFPPFSEEQREEGEVDFTTPERIDTVRLYSTGEADGELSSYDFPLNEEEPYESQERPRAVRIALGVEFGLACALCGAIFLTNVFMPNSAVNTFFRALNTPAEEVNAKHYTEFTLTPVVSELSDAKLQLSDSGVLSFTDECCVYPAANGKVSELTKAEDGSYTLKISYTDTFTSVMQGLNVVYYEVGDEVKANVPVAFSKGEQAVQVTMYSEGELLNCFQLTEENCLAWIQNEA